MLTYIYHSDKSKSMSKTKELVTVVSNATVAKLIDAPRKAQLQVAEMTSYTVTGYGATSFARTTGWDGKKSFFSFKTQSFPAGFARNVVSRLKKLGYDVKWIKKPLPAPLGEVRPEVDEFGYTERYEYQPMTVDRLVKYGQIIGSLATGAGKSRVARMAYKTVGRKTLFLTTRGVLMHQMKNNFEECLGESVGVIGDGEFSPNDNFNVGMVQTLSQGLEKKDFETELEREISLEEDAMVRKVEAFKRSLTRKKTLSPTAVMSEVKKQREKLLKARPSDAELVARVKDKVTRHNTRRVQIVEFLKSVEFLILEEAHEAGSNEYFNVCMACSNAYYRLALTATAFKRADAESNMRLMAVSGPIGITVTEKELIDLGVLSTPKFYYAPVQKVKGLYKSTGWQQAYKLGITGNDARNQQIVEYAKVMAEYGLTTMTLVIHKEHGKLLKLMLQKAGLKASFIDGDATQDERKAALNKLANGDVNVLIGTTILDVGVDVPSVGCVMLAGGGKAEIALRQRIGRGLRAKKSGPNICFVIDFEDRYNEHLTKHAVARRKIVHETPGFSENVITDLNPALYGFTKEKIAS